MVFIMVVVVVAEGSTSGRLFTGPSLWACGRIFIALGLLLLILEIELGDDCLIFVAGESTTVLLALAVVALRYEEDDLL